MSKRNMRFRCQLFSTIFRSDFRVYEEIYMLLQSFANISSTPRSPGIIYFHVQVGHRPLHQLRKAFLGKWKKTTRAVAPHLLYARLAVLCSFIYLVLRPCPPAVSITAYSRLITAPPRPFKCRGPSFFATLDHDLFWLSPDSPPVPGSVRL